MSIIKITTSKIAGALFIDKSADATISVGKGSRVPVTMTGYLGAQETKGEDGKYTPSEFGRLRVRAGSVKGEKGNRIAIDVDGGLRGVLFPAKEGADYAYQGNIENGGGREYPVFARKVEGKSGFFLSLSSMEVQDKQEQGEAAKATPAPAEDFADDEIPF